MSTKRITRKSTRAKPSGLNPCPKCGASGELQCIKAGMYWVVCSNGNCNRSISISAWRSPEDAAQAWNSAGRARLNPEAIYDLYDACKAAEEWFDDDAAFGDMPRKVVRDQLLAALAKASHPKGRP